MHPLSASHLKFANVRWTPGPPVPPPSTGEISQARVALSTKGRLFLDMGVNSPVTHAVASLGLAHFMPFDLDANPLRNIFDKASYELLLEIAYSTLDMYPRFSWRLLAKSTVDSSSSREGRRHSAPLNTCWGCPVSCPLNCNALLRRARKFTSEAGRFSMLLPAQAVPPSGPCSMAWLVACMGPGPSAPPYHTLSFWQPPTRMPVS